jgi:polyisoprenoid-binding protein YceI
MNRHTLLLTCLVTVAAGSPAFADTPAAANGLVVVKGGKLRLEGQSTLHPYHADALTFQTRFTLSPGATGDVETLFRAGAVKGLELSVPVSGLRSGEEGLDKNLRKAMKADQFAEVRFVLDSYRVLPGSATGERFTLELMGRLTIAGVEKPTVLQATAVPTKGGVQVSGATAIGMRDFGVEPPALMLGALKTDNQVTIRFEIEVRAG